MISAFVISYLFLSLYILIMCKLEILRFRTAKLLIFSRLRKYFSFFFQKIMNFAYFWLFFRTFAPQNEGKIT